MDGKLDVIFKRAKKSDGNFDLLKSEALRNLLDESATESRGSSMIDLSIRTRRLRMDAALEVIRVEVMKLSLKPGDRLVVRVPAAMTAADVRELNTYLQTFLGPDIPGMILMGDEITLSVIEPAEKLF